jgi:hypothetical protein
MNLSVRILKAFKANPVLDLARELFKEGYTEESFMDAIKEERNKGGIVDDAAFIHVRNYLRDLKLGIEK